MGGIALRGLSNFKQAPQSMKRTLSILSALAFASTLAFAADKPAAPPPGGHPKPEEVFKKLDTDDSGTVSLKEFLASPRAQKDPAKAKESFKKMDRAGNGELTLEEFKAGHHDGPGDRGGKGLKPGPKGGIPGGKSGGKPAAPK